MAYSTWYFKRGDRDCVARTQLVDENNDPVSVTNATVRFKMGTRGEAPKVNAVCTLVSAATGVVQYKLAQADLDTAGTFDAEWEVTFQDGSVQTFPSDRYDVVKVTEQVG